MSEHKRIVGVYLKHPNAPGKSFVVALLGDSYWQVVGCNYRNGFQTDGSAELEEAELRLDTTKERPELVEA